MQSAASARDQLSGLLEQLISKTPGTSCAVLASSDGLKMAWTQQPINDVDTLAATVTSLYALGRQQFSTADGRMRQIFAEHDAGFLFVMSAGASFTNTQVVGTVLAVVATKAANPGQVAHEMEHFIKGLDEHLVVGARNRL
jgi:predicted regulator of Ras-like GTPase activity (Roadblock/LC7/MglB family)